MFKSHNHIKRGAFFAPQRLEFTRALCYVGPAPMKTWPRTRLLAGLLAAVAVLSVTACQGRESAAGVVLATPDNMNEPAIRKLLVPDLSILNR
jgi:hypothetical protein